MTIEAIRRTAFKVGEFRYVHAVCRGLIGRRCASAVALTGCSVSTARWHIHRRQAGPLNSKVLARPHLLASTRRERRLCEGRLKRLCRRKGNLLSERSKLLGLLGQRR